MRRVLGVLVVLAALAGAVGWWLTAPTRVAVGAFEGMQGDAAAGEAVFWAGGCASCHADDDAEGADRLILSGGHRLVSDFGTFVAPNISPSPAGIGGWSAEEFVTAMVHGTSPEGRHYYPAFPYSAYRLAETQDLLNLWAYLQSLPPSDVANQPHEVGFPFTIRRGIGAWKLLFLRDDYVITAQLTDAQARGRYLAEALAHCGECHTPRGVLGQLDHARWFAGAPNPSGRGRIPNITPAELTWSEQDLVAYFTDGFTPDFDVAGGSMGDVIDGLAQLPEADRAAIAAYLQVIAEAE